MSTINSFVPYYGYPNTRRVCGYTAPVNIFRFCFTVIVLRQDAVFVSFLQIGARVCSMPAIVD